MLVVALVGLSLTACNDGDDLSTDQYGNQISLQSFGPCPVLRGGTLYLYGSNLDQISEVDLPGADPITAFEVLQSGKQSKISILVPAEKCEPGQIVLKTIKGGEITSVSPITYREDIVFDKFFVGDNEENLTGNVGDIVTIKGDYLNLMHGVIFEKEDTIKEDQFLEHTRYTIKLAIPVEAKTGVIKLTDLAKEPAELESEEALNINTPEVTPIHDVTIKAGEALSMKGTDFDQIASVKFEGAEVKAEEFKSQGKQEVVVNVPAKATDGTVYVVTKSGVEIAVGNIITVVPTNLVAAPSPVKNGATVTITGKDLDLVTDIAFPNNSEEVKNKKFGAQVSATVPKDAQEKDKDGNGIALSLANGKVVYVDYTLVKPVVTACTPNDITAGEEVTMTGTDLDLVKSITFPGKEEVTVDTSKIVGTASQLKLTVPKACEGTGFKLNLMNGTSFEVKNGLTIKASTAPSLASSTEAQCGQTMTIKGTNFNNVAEIYIGGVKVTNVSDRSTTSMSFTVPEGVQSGAQALKLVTSDGKSFEVGKVTVSPSSYDISGNCVTVANDSKKQTFPVTLTWDDNGRFYVNRTGALDISVFTYKEGVSKIIFHIKKGTSGDIQFNNASWGNFFGDTLKNGGSETVECKLTQDMIDWLTGKKKDEWNTPRAFCIQGSGVAIESVELIP